MNTMLHANATTTPKTRALIQASSEPVAVLARRFGVSEPTIRKWRARKTTQDRSHIRHKTPMRKSRFANVVSSAQPMRETENKGKTGCNNHMRNPTHYAPCFAHLKMENSAGLLP